MRRRKATGEVGRSTSEIHNDSVRFLVREQSMWMRGQRPYVLNGELETWGHLAATKRMKVSAYLRKDAFSEAFCARKKLSGERCLRRIGNEAAVPYNRGSLLREHWQKMNFAPNRSVSKLMSPHGGPCEYKGKDLRMSMQFVATAPVPPFSPSPAKKQNPLPISSVFFSLRIDISVGITA